MGLHQRTETGGLVSLLICALVAWISMSVCTYLLPAAWLISRRRFLVASVIITACSTVSFIAGYLRHSQSLSEHRTWYAVARRLGETLALAVVYASTLFLISFTLFNGVSLLMGPMFLDYLIAACAACAGVASYVTYVQAQLMDAKTLASLLPLFVISGVSVAALTTDDQHWFENNFSQLGDRTTFAARMFNSTLALAGVCVIIVSYFAVSELLTTYRSRLEWNKDQGPDSSRSISHYRLRLTLLSVMLTISGLCFIGVGFMRYTPHPTLHNLSARGLTVTISLLLLTLPWLAPQLSRAMYVTSYVAFLICCFALGMWLLGRSTLTNVEAVAGLLFLGWFIIFSRQIAAIESDRMLQWISEETGKDTTEGLETTQGRGQGNPSSRLSSTR
ncbi:hypothetical protein [Bifidobacterium bombi]|uniref:Putative membrane protein n=1 Tax=Bifidobacterium bombi DSM 19703 TaxID=1341695 RepID=A0A080N4A7_9BIFI|nr:hypothetical protein [Bifidobacterium bombi]KFF31190.1 putative membrane protein [Bifidobacterium bombi DSM 19703]